MPEPIQSGGNIASHYDAARQICSTEAPPDSVVAGPAPPPTTPAAAGPPAAPPAVQTLVDKHTSQCRQEQAALLVAGAGLARGAAGMVVAAPTLLGEIPLVAGFIASSILFGTAAANYLNCTEEAKRQPGG